MKNTNKFDTYSRGDWIRTSDSLTPSQIAAAPTLHRRHIQCDTTTRNPRKSLSYRWCHTLSIRPVASAV
jgi:hypothetical protein